MTRFRFERPVLPASLQELRREVRAFMAEEFSSGRVAPRRHGWMSFDRDFSRRCGRQGYIGMTWPKKYGGHERTALERFVVCEELLALSAPLTAHWIGDRQSGPQILRNGSEALRIKVLPHIAAGECTISIGMSEPDSGSDLASIRSKGTRTDGGWLLDGRKIWTTNAHFADYMIVLCRTEAKSENRHAGLTQFLVEMKSPGVSVRPLRSIAGALEFNEVLFESCFVPDDQVLGAPGDGWRLVTEELAFERSGPERFLSTFALLQTAIDALAEAGANERAAVEIGRLVVRMSSVRQLSLSIAALLQAGQSPRTEAALMKELGTTLEQDIPETVRSLLGVSPDPEGSGLALLLAEAVLNAPSFTLRGGTREILTGMVAKELGVR